MKTTKLSKPRNYGTMTESQYWAKVRSALRKGFMYWKPGMAALEAASRPYKGDNKRQKKEYQCAKCKKWFKRTEVDIDHVKEVGSLKSEKDIVDFLKRLTPEDIKAYQILCKEDHKEKTNNARKIKKG